MKIQSCYCKLGLTFFSDVTLFPGQNQCPIDVLIYLQAYLIICLAKCIITRLCATTVY